jgi:hypothetical protein
MTMHRMLLLSVAVAACHSDSRPPVPAPAPAPSVAKGDQTTLAKELDDADRRGTWLEVKSRWQGQRLRWTVTRQALLCASAEACNVAAFPIQRPAQHGWMPKLNLTPATYAKIEQTCGAREQCELTFEGTLSQLIVSGDKPTSMQFSDVVI